MNLLFICAATDAMAIMMKYCQSCGNDDEDMFEFVADIACWTRDVALLRSNTVSSPTHVHLKDIMSRNVKFVAANKNGKNSAPHQQSISNKNNSKNNNKCTNINNDINGNKRNNTNGSNVFVFCYKNEILLRREGYTMDKCSEMIEKEMTAIFDKLIQWGDKKFDKPIINLYKYALEIFDPRNLEGKTVTQLQQKIDDVMTPICDILNDGEWGVFNIDLLKKEMKTWTGLVYQTLKSRQWQKKIKNIHGYEKHVSTRIKSYWGTFVTNKDNNVLFPYLTQLAYSLINRKTTIYCVERFHKRRRDTRGNKNRRRMLFETERKVSEIYVNLPKVLSDETLMKVAIKEKEKEKERMSMRINKTKDIHQLKREIAPAFDKNENSNANSNEQQDFDVAMT